VAEDLGLELTELGTGLDAELVHEAGAGALIGLERFGLPARSVEREHQLPAERLAERVLLDERL